MVLSNIRIQGFRGLNDLKIDKMNAITVFTGKNNVGKSACLEAICLLMSGKNEFDDALGNDLIKTIIYRRATNPMAWTYLIHKGSERAFITSSEEESNTGKSETSIVVSDVIEKTISESVLKNFLRKRESAKEDLFYTRPSRHSQIEINSRIVVHYKGKTDTVAEVFTVDRTSHKVAASSHNSGDGGAKVLFLPNAGTTEVGLHDMAAKSKGLHQALDSLSTKIANFKDLRKVEDHLRIFYNDGSNMPFFTMGDGIKASIIATLAIHAVDDGTIIMEEPENFLHPGLLNNLIDELILAADSRGTQIFLSTHNIELLERLLERNPDISVVQLNELDGAVKARVMNRQMAWEQLEELGMDLRGV